MDVWSKNMKEYNFILLYATDLIYFYLISKNFVWTENVTQCLMCCLLGRITSY